MSCLRRLELLLFLGQDRIEDIDLAHHIKVSDNHFKMKRSKSGLGELLNRFSCHHPYILNRTLLAEYRS